MDLNQLFNNFFSQAVDQIAILMEASAWKRDFRQIWASLWRIGVSIRRQKSRACVILYPTIASITILLFSLFIYNPVNIELRATD